MRWNRKERSGKQEKNPLTQSPYPFPRKWKSIKMLKQLIENLIVRAKEQKKEEGGETKESKERGEETLSSGREPPKGRKRNGKEGRNAEIQEPPAQFDSLEGYDWILVRENKQKSKRKGGTETSQVGSIGRPKEALRQEKHTDPGNERKKAKFESRTENEVPDSPPPLYTGSAMKRINIM